MGELASNNDQNFPHLLRILVSSSRTRSEALTTTFLSLQAGYISGIVLSNTLNASQFGILQFKENWTTKADLQKLPDVANQLIELVKIILQPLFPFGERQNLNRQQRQRQKVSREILFLVDLLPACIDSLKYLKLLAKQEEQQKQRRQQQQKLLKKNSSQTSTKKYFKLTLDSDEEDSSKMNNDNNNNTNNNFIENNNAKADCLENFDVIDRIMNANWPSNAIVAILNIFSELSLTIEQCNELQSKIANQIDCLETSDFAPLLKQILMFIERYKSLMWVNLLRLVLRQVGLRMFKLFHLANVVSLLKKSCLKRKWQQLSLSLIWQFNTNRLFRI